MLTTASETKTIHEHGEYKPKIIVGNEQATHHPLIFDIGSHEDEQEKEDPRHSANRPWHAVQAWRVGFRAHRAQGFIPRCFSFLGTSLKAGKEGLETELQV